MLTFDQINLTEDELSEYMIYIYEAEDHPEKEMYAKFIGEATLDQKIGLLNQMILEVQDPSKQGHLRKGVMSHLGVVAGLGVFWLAYRGIRAAFDKCSRKCSIAKTNTFMRQKCMAECNVGQAKNAAAAATKISCASGDSKCEAKKKELIAKHNKKMADAQNKHLAYKEKHKKLRYTV